MVNIHIYLYIEKLHIKLMFIIKLNDKFFGNNLVIMSTYNLYSKFDEISK